jgi:hypothetical protein
LFSETSLPCAYKPEGSPTTMCPTLLDVLRKPAATRNFYFPLIDQINILLVTVS